jgi:Ca2+-transporting ATPase
MTCQQHRRNRVGTVSFGSSRAHLVVWVTAGRERLPLEAVTIAVILVLNAGLGVWQERKAESALEKLEQLTAPRVWTLRDGKLVQIDNREIVPGDIIRLEAGDRVPADAGVQSAENLSVDESVLTGESLPVEKSVGDEGLAGTLVFRGKAYLEITRTGPRSAMGRLATLLGGVKAERTPLERRLEAFGHRVARWILGLAVLITAGGIWVVERIAKRKAVVRKLAAVEALGSVTVIATDKTGTLTENRMEVRELDTPELERALRTMVLANEAEADTGAGDPLEIALLRHAQDRGRHPEAMRADCPRVSGRPFDSAWKFMRTTVTEDGRSNSYLKGAPEVVLGRCDMAEDQRVSWSEKVEAYAAEGYRLLALAWGEGERETNLNWLGLVLLWDPPRPEVPDAVRRAREAGIRVIMITGDHPATALTVARTVGIVDVKVVSGADLEALPPVELRRVLSEVHVFARVNPEHKLRIVEALKADGEIVAVTGDGVNDGPALKRSDVGVAMGERGSDVTREVADVVLLDDNFATIVAAIEEGRSIYENVQKFIRFLFSTNLSEVLVVTLGAFASFLIGLRDAAGNLLLPLTAAQLLWINLVTDGAPALALGVDRNPGVMQRTPRDPASPLLDTLSLRFIVLSGTVKAMAAFAILGLLPALVGQSLEVTRTSTFLFMAAGQLLFAYPARRTDLRPPTNVLLHLAVVVSFAIQLPVVWVPVLMEAFDTVRLSVAVWAWVAGTVLVAWGFAELFSRAIWWRRGSRS